MKKIALFIALAAVSLTSCSNDDDNNGPALNASYLEGVWVETHPDPDMHTLSFHGSTVTLTRQFSVIGEYDYEISGNTLLLSTPSSAAPASEHVAEIVNDSVMRLSNMVIVGPWDNSLPAEGTLTFQKTNIIID
jgi:hypothetical protein